MRPQLSRFLFDRAEWSEYQKELKLVYSGQNKNTSCEEIENAIKGAANKIIQKKEKKNGNSNRTKMWWNKSMKKQ